MNSYTCSSSLPSRKATVSISSLMSRKRASFLASLRSRSSSGPSSSTAMPRPYNVAEGSARDPLGPRRRHHAPPYTRRVSRDEYVVETPVVRELVAAVRAAIETAASPEEACDAFRPRFAELVGEPEWLPAEYQEGTAASGMGGGI